MGREIERKFLIKNSSWRDAADRGQRIRQGYLADAKRASVRVRAVGEEAAWLNIKSATLDVQRQEFEYGIPVADAEQMLATLCERPLIEKTRYRLRHAGHVWEIDVFEGENQGLIVAEIELDDPGEAFSRPGWLGREVSSDPRYYNVCLVSHPFRDWPDRAEIAAEGPEA